MKLKLNKNGENYKKLLDEFFLPKDATQVEIIDALLYRVLENELSINIDRNKLITVKRK